MLGLSNTVIDEAVSLSLYNLVPALTAICGFMRDTQV